MPIQICIGLVDAVLPPNILGNRLGILTQILISMNYYIFFLYFREVPSIQKKIKALVKENFWFTSYKLPDLLTVEMFFKLCIPKTYVHNLERNWKNSVCIGVRILLHYTFLNFMAVFTQKSLNISVFAYSFPFEKINFSLIDPTRSRFINCHPQVLKNPTQFLGFASYH